MPATAAPLTWGPAPAPQGAGRCRLGVAAALALGLHVLLLSPVRPTLIGTAAQEAPPRMLVRLLTPEALKPAGGAASPKVLAGPLAAPVFAAVVASRPTASVPAPALASGGDPKAPAPAPAAPPSPVPEPGLPAAPDYFAGGTLDPGPRPLQDVDPAYPNDANQQEGSVVLRLLISESGLVDNVAVVRAYPAGLFEASALEAFGMAKFSPGKMLGVAVKSQITIEVMFTPINRGKVSGRSY